MKSRSFYTFTVFLIFVTCIGFIACEGPAGPQGEHGLAGPQGEQGPAGTAAQTYATIKGFLVSWGDYNDWDAYITVDNCTGIPIIKINDTEMLLLSEEDMIGVFSGQIGNATTATISVEYISYDNGLKKAEAQLSLPGYFEILSFSPDTLAFHKDQEILITWSKSERAEMYVIDTFGDVSYYTLTDGESRDYDNIEFISTENTTNTYFQTTLQNLFPNIPFDNIEIDRFYLYNDIGAVSGAFAPGSESNISGDGTGYIYAINFAEEFYFQKPAVNSTQKKIDREMLVKNMINNLLK